MDFKVPYLRAMIERAPAMYRRLKQEGAVDDHLQSQSEEAHRLFEEMMAGRSLDDPVAVRESEEIVMAQMLEFPMDESTAT